MTRAPVPAGPLRHLVLGPPGHGVVRYAEQLLAAADVPDDRVVRVGRRVGAADVTELRARLDHLGGTDGSEQRVHLHVTDHLLGRSPEEALEVVTALAAGRRLSLTLHDLPQASDGAPAARRRACYAGLAALADDVVVSSDHEAALLRAVLDDGTRQVRVVPLAVPPAPDPARPDEATTGPREVAVLGFVYPGKGHAEVLAAMTGLPDDVGLRVLGGASPGHDDLLDDLARDAAAAGRPLRVDGWVPDDDLPGLLRTAAVPVFAPRHVSASASLTAWLSAGRRPVTTRGAYTEEVERRSPGALLLVDDEPGALAAGIAAALSDPASTHLTPGTRVGTSPPDAARQTFQEPR